VLYKNNSYYTFFKWTISQLKLRNDDDDDNGRSLCITQDSQWAAAHLGNVRGFYRVADDKFQHWDFLWSINVNPLLYDHIIPMFR